MKNNSIKISLLVSLSLFCVLLFTFFFFYKKINDNIQQSQSKEVEWQAEAERRDEIKTLDNAIKIIEKERTQLETHFARSSDVVPFLNTIEKLGSRAGAKTDIISVRISEDRMSLIVDMKASGSFLGLYRFLTLLENSPYELEFVAMNLGNGVSLDSSNTKSSKWEATFKVKLLNFIQ